MSTKPNATTVFTPEQIAQAAKGNVYGLCLVAVAYAKAHGLSPAEYWAYVGGQFAASWKRRGTAEEVAQGAVLNMVSAGCELRSSSGDETQATAVLGGWPPEQRYGLTQAEADTVWGIFEPIAESQGYSFAWRRQGDEVTITVFRQSRP
jgi:hypothetical protein